MNEKLISLTQNAQPNDRQNQLKNQANNTTYDWRVHGLYQKKDWIHIWEESPRGEQTKHD